MISDITISVVASKFLNTELNMPQQEPRPCANSKFVFRIILSTCYTTYRNEIPKWAERARPLLRRWREGGWYPAISWRCKLISTYRTMPRNGKVENLPAQSSSMPRSVTQSHSTSCLKYISKVYLISLVVRQGSSLTC